MIRLLWKKIGDLLFNLCEILSIMSQEVKQ